MTRCVRLGLLVALMSVGGGLAAGQTDASQVSFAVVHAFQNGADGAFPGYAALILDPLGNLYGTTTQGGMETGNCGTEGCGTIFKIDSSGNETVFYAFSTATNGPKFPYGTLLRDAKGDFYGTTLGGGTSGSGCFNYGCGTAYLVSAAGVETTLYNFTGGADGATPTAGFTLGTDGRLYSTTHAGGTQAAGVVFAITRQGAQSVVHSFIPDSTDGVNTWSGLARDDNGNFYGSTFAGGGSNPNCGGLFGCGVIYEVSESGTESILYRFQGLSDGNWPYGGLIRDKEGNLYGTSQGGTGQYGTVFKLDSAGNFTVLHTFTGGAGGEAPLATLARDSAGTLYGTTFEGGGSSSVCGNYGCGTVFSLTSSGQFKILHSFSGGIDGWEPSAAVTIAPGGVLYGTASAGGLYNSGLVFKISPH